MFEHYQTIEGSRARTSLGKRETTTMVPDFVIAIPEVMPPYGNCFTSFENDLQTIFDNAAMNNDEEWTNVITNLPAPGIPSEMLPSLDTLPRPERLFESSLPCHLIVKLLHNGMVVQSSHQPSLELLSDYLTKYTKSMKNVSTRVCIHIFRCLLFERIFFPDTILPPAIWRNAFSKGCMPPYSSEASRFEAYTVSPLSPAPFF